MITPRCILALWLALGSCTAFADAPAPSIQGRIIVSGFEPFDGRQKNASFQLAKLISTTYPQRDITLIEVPVVWGAPEKTLASGSSRPWTLWLAFGEGTNEFQIETVADNQRADYPDNQRQKPRQQTILPDAPSKLTSRFPAQALAQALRAAGLPTRVSKEAGNYLCEEMLFNLLHSQTQSPGSVVLFIHTPILGARVKMPDGTLHLMDAELMQRFAKAILPAIENSLAATKP